MSVEGLLGTDRAFAADLVALRPHPGQQASAANIAALLAGSAIVASHRTGDPRVQDAYSLRCAPQVHGAARDALAFAESVRRPRAGRGHRQPGGAGRRPGRVGRQLPRRAAGPRLRPARHRRRRRRQHERAAHRPLPRRRPQPRAAAVPRPRARRRQRPDDRPVHRGRPRGRVPAARRSGQRRHHPDLGHAGGPRVDGLVGRPQAAHGARPPGPGARRRAGHRGAGHRPAGPAGPGPGDRRGPRRPAGRRRGRPRAPIGCWRPSWRRPPTSSADGAVVRAAEREVGPLA